jgi:outer membrane protein OmpA-like peptidoglycan-associated protein
MKKLRHVLLPAVISCCNMLHAQQADSIKVKVYFALDKYNISPAAKITLDDFIKKHREITWINIEAFTDSRASVIYNDKLAHNRATSVQDYLLLHGLSKLAETHINAFGKRKLLDLGNTETAHQNNRVVILTCYVVAPVLAKPAPPKDTVKPEPPAIVKVVPPPPPKDTLKPAPPVVMAPKPDTVKPVAVVKAPPVVFSVPADTIMQAAPPVPDAAEDGGPTIQVKENVPTGEIDRGLVERIITAIKHAKVGQSLVLHTIYFEEGRHVFVQTANTALNAVLEVMKTRPTIEFEVQGHVCCTDSLMEDALDFDTHRFDLSYARAKAVAEFMVKNGIAASRVQQQVGFGSRRRIVFPEKTVADRNLNRRVEFKIVKK